MAGLFVVGFTLVCLCLFAVVACLFVMLFGYFSCCYCGYWLFMFADYVGVCVLICGVYMVFVVLVVVYVCLAVVLFVVVILLFGCYVSGLL